jgi:hypothetical protein
MTKKTRTKQKKVEASQKTDSKTKVEQKNASNFNLVAQGKCPHDNAKLGDEVAGKKIGITRVCSKCKHVWYLNRKIHTCACRTCQKGKKEAK